MALGEMTAKLVIQADAARAERAVKGFGSTVSKAMGRVEARMALAQKRTEAFNKRWQHTLQLSQKIGRSMQMMGLGIMAGSALAVRAYMVQEDAEANLTQILGENSKALIENAAAIQTQTRYGDEAIIQATAIGATYIGLRSDMEGAQKAAVNMAEAYGMDLVGAMHLLGKASTGQVTYLTRVGIMVDKVAFKARGMAAVYDQISEETKDLAFNTETASKAWDQLKNRLGDIAEKVGPVVLEVLEKITPTIEKMVGWIEKAVETDMGKWALEAGVYVGPLSLLFGTMATKIGEAVFAWKLLTAAQLKNIPAARAAGAANVAAAAGVGAGAGVAGAAGAGAPALGGIAAPVMGGVAAPVAAVAVTAVSSVGVGVSIGEMLRERGVFGKFQQQTERAMQAQRMGAGYQRWLLGLDGRVRRELMKLPHQERLRVWRETARGQKQVMAAVREAEQRGPARERGRLIERPVIAGGGFRAPIVGGMVEQRNRERVMSALGMRPFPAAPTPALSPIGPEAQAGQARAQEWFAGREGLQAQPMAGAGYTGGYAAGPGGRRVTTARAADIIIEHRLSSDDQTAGLLMGNRDFRDEMKRLIREEGGQQGWDRRN